MVRNKNKLFSFLIIAVLLLVNALFAQNQNAVSPNENKVSEDHYSLYFHQAEYRLGKYEFEESIKNCELALKNRPNDFLVRAMMCLDYYEIAEKLDLKKPGDKDKKIDMYNKMIQIAEQGITCAPDKGECYFMRGLANARMATTKGVLSQLFTAKQIETDWLVAVSRKSDYVTPNGENLQASSCLALGVYYRLCPTFFLLKWIFGISGSLDKAVDYCKKAYDLDSTRIEIVKECGVALITRGLDSKNEMEIARGKEYLRKVALLPLRLQTDKIDIEHSKILLENISLCPGYSRDEEQDISEEKFAKENSSSH
jgi:tetratricopeptide (TPR) repeat protein